MSVANSYRYFEYPLYKENQWKCLQIWWNFAQCVWLVLRLVLCNLWDPEWILCAACNSHGYYTIFRTTAGFSPVSSKFLQLINVGEISLKRHQVDSLFAIRRGGGRFAAINSMINTMNIAIQPIQTPGNCSNPNNILAYRIESSYLERIDTQFYWQCPVKYAIDAAIVFATSKNHYTVKDFPLNIGNNCQMAVCAYSSCPIFVSFIKSDTHDNNTNWQGMREYSDYNSRIQ